jgi:hypothetical protein
MAPTMAPRMAAMMAPRMAPTVAPGMATATGATATITTAAAAEEEGRGLLLTADQSDPHLGKKHRQTKHDNTIHPQILHLLTGTVSGNNRAVLKQSHRGFDGLSATRCDRTVCGRLLLRPPRSLL